MMLMPRILGNGLGEKSLSKSLFLSIRVAFFGIIYCLCRPIRSSKNYFLLQIFCFENELLL